jgi:UDP-glucose 4-epimerase
MAIYLVTGGCGFIGSHLCEALIERGHHLRILDDLSTGSLDNVPASAEILRGSVADPELVNEAMKGVAGCFHLAAVASVERSTNDWFGVHRTNLSGTIAVFDAARQGGRHPIPVVYASSAAVYGDCKQLPIRENALAQPRSPYGADKYGCELHGRVAFAVYGVPTIGLRFFNVYGPRQHPASPYSGVISIFCDRLLRHQPIDIFGDGSQTRDFIFVGDVAATLIAAMERAQERCEVLNVCTGRRTSVLELARLVGELCGCEPQIRFQTHRAGEISHSRGDPDLMRRHLGLADPVELRPGLIATLSWMQPMIKATFDVKRTCDTPNHKVDSTTTSFDLAPPSRFIK